VKILAVDLAAKFSAGIALDRGREVHLQFDTWGRTQVGTALLIADVAATLSPDLILVEDVPYGISKQFMIKPVLRLQGMVIQELTRSGFEDRTLFIAPNTWKSGLGLPVRGAKPPVFAEAAAKAGYTPPDLLEVHAADVPAKGPERTKIRGLLRKAATDYVDAYLIGEWAVGRSEEQIRTTQGVQPIVEGNTTWLARQSPTPSQTS